MNNQIIVEPVNNNIVMAMSKTRTSSFSRNLATVPSSTPGLKYGSNGTIFISSGIPDLDSSSLLLPLSLDEL